jgi:gliding motility-associated protein GldC
MQQSTITIDVNLDEQKIPEQILWKASDSSMDSGNKAKAMILSFWDGDDKTALRIDLWTRDMKVEEMSDFFYQTLMTMADTYDRATHQSDLVNDIKKFAKDFYKQSQQEQLKQI